MIRAVKILRKDKVSKFELDRLFHEIEVLKNLNHPNVIKISEYYEDEKRHYIVGDLCTGGELFDELATNVRLSEEITSVIA